MCHRRLDLDLLVEDLGPASRWLRTQLEQRCQGLA